MTQKSPIKTVEDPLSQMGFAPIEEALHARIEVRYVRRVIRELRLPPLRYLRGKFVHWVEQAGLVLEFEQRNREAIALYLRGLVVASMSEAFYQGLVRCYTATGNRAEALNIYRRMRLQLSVVLGVKPSASSKALAEKRRVQK